MTGAVPMFVSITRLRLRSVRFFLPFVWHSRRSARQAEASAGCRGVRLRKTSGLAFWTLTGWDSEDAMKAFRGRSPHREIMAKLPHWCDEAAVGHWIHQGDELPSWEAGVERLAAEGRLSRVLHPSAEQKAGRISVE